MKIIFLDFDGVLNQFISDEKIEYSAIWNDIPLDSSYFERAVGQLDYDKVMRLNSIIEQTGAYVVFSTSWKHVHGFDFLIRVLKYHGFNGFVLGATQTLSYFPAEYKNRTRADSIEYWLKHMTNVESYVILDDFNMDQLSSHHVKTDPFVGLTDEDVEKAISILNNKRE